MHKQKLISKAIAVLVTSAIVVPLSYGADKADLVRPERLALAERADTIEEVIITARRKEENLQEVPISVTAISGESLQRQGVTNLLSLVNQIPSLNVLGKASPKVFTVAIRGVRNNSFLIMDDPTVATYFAEGLVAHPFGIGEMFFDLQSVQVLKGPQGTLFGKNTTGGALLLEPNKASIEEGLGGNVSFTVGDYGKQKFEGVVNVPLNDVAALRVAGFVDKRDGYSRNVITGRQRDDVNNQALRVSLLLKPTKDVTSHTILDYINEDSEPASVVIFKVYPGGGSPFYGNNATALRLLADAQARGPYNMASWQGSNNPALDFFSPVRCATTPGALCREGSEPKDKLKSWGFLNNTKVDFDGFSIKNIISYREMDHDGDGTDSAPAADPLGTPLIGLLAGNHTHTESWSEEFQVLGKALDDRLDWVAGAIVMEEKGRDAGWSYALAPSWVKTQGTADNKSSGVFLQGTYKVNDKLNLTVGARKTFDKRQIDDQSVRNNGTLCQVVDPVTKANYPITNCHLIGDKSWSANTWNVSADYKVTDGTLVYVTTRRGYHSGGFSLRAHASNIFGYDPEYLRDWEVGVKSDWQLAGRPIRTNLAVFNSDYTNQQVAITNNTFPVTGFVGNVGKSKITGFEFEYTYKMFSHFELSGYFSHVNPRYVDYRDANGTDLSSQSFGLPKSMAGLSGMFDVPLDSGGQLQFRADVYHQGDADTSSNAKFALTSYGVADVPGYTTVNLRADWRSVMGSPFDVGLYVTNAGDKRYIDSGAILGGVVAGHYAAPRMYGVQVTYRFGSSAKTE